MAIRRGLLSTSPLCPAATCNQCRDRGAAQGVGCVIRVVVDTSAVLQPGFRSTNLPIRLAALVVLSWAPLGCNQAYDVTTNLRPGKLQLRSIPSRPEPESPIDATVSIAGAQIQIDRDGAATVVYPDGLHKRLGRGPLAPFPEELRRRPDADSVPAQVVTSELFLAQLLRPLPDLLREQIESADPRVRRDALSMALNLTQADEVNASGLLGRWWHFVLTYRLYGGDRVRLQDALGRARPASQPMK